MKKRITIIPEDQFVSIDGRGFNRINLSSIPDNIHAVQWYGEFGSIEYKPDSHGDRLPNKEISSMDEFKEVIAAWEKACNSADAPPPPPPPLTLEERLAQFSNRVQSMLDAKAREHNYDNIQAACTYTTSRNPKYAAEAQACVEWRDAVWAKYYELQNKIRIGVIPVPAEEELLDSLPQMQWPETKTGFFSRLFG